MSGQGREQECAHDWEVITVFGPVGDMNVERCLHCGEMR